MAVKHQQDLDTGANFRRKSQNTKCKEILWRPGVSKKRLISEYLKALWKNAVVCRSLDKLAGWLKCDSWPPCRSETIWRGATARDTHWAATGTSNLYTYVFRGGLSLVKTCQKDKFIGDNRSNNRTNEHDDGNFEVCQWILKFSNKKGKKKRDFD